MRASDLMARDPALLPRTAKVSQAIALMEEREISSVIVQREHDGEPWGIVTRSDFVYKVAAPGLDASQVTLGDIMRPALLTVHPTLNLGHASRLMRRFRVRHLPVVDGQELVGVLVYHDVLSLFNLLRCVPFFQKLSAEDLIALLNLASLRHCPAGHVVIKEGDTGRDLFLLESGEAVVSTRRAGRIARIRAGELFGEMELFGGRRSATVRTAHDSRILVIDGQSLVKLATRREHLGTVVFESMSRILSDRLRRANRLVFLRGIWAHRALVLRATLIGVAVFVALVLGTATVSETPSLCPTCHNMRPYHTTWTESRHSEIRCTKCHWSYGLRGAFRGKITGLAMVVRYATRTHGPKPEAKVNDESCLRSGCHAVGQLGDGFRTVGGDHIPFNHDVHLRPLTGVGTLRCASCHNHRGQEAHFSVLPATCFLCHFPSAGIQPTPCRGCHEFKPDDTDTSVPARLDHVAFRPETNCLACHGQFAQGSGSVESSRCTSCHLRPRTLATEEMHQVHVQDEDIDCFDCHSVIGHPGPSQKSLAGQCDACHGDVHAAQERLYLGEGGAGVAARPALMHYFHVECTACHGTDAEGADSTVVPRHTTDVESACLDCHEVTTADRVRMWMTTIEQSLDRVQRLLSRFEERAGAKGEIRHPEAYRLYEEARLNYGIVAADPSAGIHNFRYAQDLLEAAEEELGKAMKLLDGSKGEQP